MTEENSENGDETDEQSDAEENIYPSKLSDSEKQGLYDTFGRISEKNDGKILEDEEDEVVIV